MVLHAFYRDERTSLQGLSLKNFGECTLTALGKQLVLVHGRQTEREGERGGKRSGTDGSLDDEEL